ncbi:MAG TPA: hypothetical protein VHR66_09870 [Gemmataceae bacterium]|jgi:hypothetical protein|nr:hypothetical protein [Gemmataceae bacterium]
MRDGDLGAGLFVGLIGAIVIIFVLVLERLAEFAWHRVFGRADDETTASPPE